MIGRSAWSHSSLPLSGFIMPSSVLLAWPPRMQISSSAWYDLSFLFVGNICIYKKTVDTLQWWQNQFLFYEMLINTNHLPLYLITDCPNCVDDTQVPNRWTMPVTKLGDKRYYLGVFFKVNSCASSWDIFFKHHASITRNGQRNLKLHLTRGYVNVDGGVWHLRKRSRCLQVGPVE